MGSEPNDWALCYLQQDLPDGIPIDFERLDISIRHPAGKIIMITGYGCQVRHGGLSEKLLYGHAPIVNRPAGVAREDTAFWTRASIGNPEEDASLCAGDSGGPAFLTGPAGASDRPRIIGVNSRVDYSLKISWFSATASVNGLAFFNSWIETFDAPICGLKYKGKIYELNCRQ